MDAPQQADRQDLVRMDSGKSEPYSSQLTPQNGDVQVREQTGSSAWGNLTKAAKAIFGTKEGWNQAAQNLIKATEIEAPARGIGKSGELIESSRGGYHPEDVQYAQGALNVKLGRSGQKNSETPLFGDAGGPPTSAASPVAGVALAPSKGMAR